MSKEEDNMVILVTGGYKHLGYWITRELKQAGFYVVATYRKDRKIAEATASELHIPVYEADVTDKTDIQELFARIESNDGMVGGVVNNASSFPTGPLQSMSREDFEGTFRTSVFATNMIINRALPGMMEMGGGKIINIGMAGLSDVRGYREVAAHAAAKTALMVLTRSWASEFKKDKIMVNMVSPGIIDYSWRDDTWRARMRRITPSGKLTPPSEVSAAVRFLIERGDVTGRVIEVDPNFHPSSV
ncbi:MAG: SDR family NAD(P)-dependent oxidoreductase [Thermoplasmatota archaeon]